MVCTLHKEREQTWRAAMTKLGLDELDFRDFTVLTLPKLINLILYCYVNDHRSHIYYSSLDIRI